MAAGMTRGPLPAEVYWRRRLLLLGLALLLVVGIARVLGSGSDGSDNGGDDSGTTVARDTAAQAGADASVTPGPGTDAPSEASQTPATPTAKELKQQARADRKAEKQAAEVAAAEAAAAAAAAATAALPEPQGDCADTDVQVTPTLPSPVAGNDVAVVLDLRTRFSPACTWTISPDQLALKITSGDDDIWSVQECPQAVPTQDLVLRRAVPTEVQVVWSGKRSDEDCSGRTSWALPGFYHVLVAALAGEPTDVQFELTKPVPAEITTTVAPKTPKQKKARSTRQAQRG